MMGGGCCDCAANYSWGKGRRFNPPENPSFQIVPGGDIFEREVIPGPTQTIEPTESDRIPVFILDTYDWTKELVDGFLLYAENELSSRYPRFFGLEDTSYPQYQCDLNTNELVDPVFGHHFFIESIIKRIAPNAEIFRAPVMTNYGVTIDPIVAERLEQIFDAWSGEGRVGIVNLSLGAYTFDNDPAPATAAVVERMRDAGWLIISAAGNDASCRPMWPAALREAISVGAIGPDGPAPFTNHGGWVDACAPGVDIIATIPAASGKIKSDPMTDAFNPPPSMTDPPPPPGGPMPTPELTPGVAGNEDDTLVRWSGTSFATPAVVGAIARRASAAYEAVDIALAPDEARQMRRTILDEALFGLIDDPVLGRIHRLGTVVNAS